MKGKELKQQKIIGLQNKCKNKSMIIIKNISMNARDNMAFRKIMKKVNITATMIKNTLLKILLDNQMNSDEVKKSIKNSSIFVLTSADSVQILNQLFLNRKKDFADKYEIIGCVDGTGFIHETSHLNLLKKIPDSNILKLQLLNILLTPITQIAKLMENIK